jgi:hypothetical protein
MNYSMLNTNLNSVTRGLIQFHELTTGSFLVSIV